MVGCEGAVRAAAPVQSGAAETDPRTAVRPAGPRSRCDPSVRWADPVGRGLRRGADRRADAADGVSGFSHRRLQREHRHRPRPCGHGRAGHRLSRRHGRTDRGRGRRPLRRRPDDGGDRTRRRSRKLRARLFAPGPARRRHDGRHIEPHAEVPGPGQGGGGIHSALGPGRHPRLAPVPETRRNPHDAGRRAGDGRGALRPELRPAERPLEPVGRCGDQLYDGRDARRL